MNTNISAAGLRHWAEQCDARARDPMTTGPEYERLMTMKAALIELAQTQEWLDGKRPPVGAASLDIAR